MLEEMEFFWRGALLGIMIAAPVGPVGLLCIRRTLHRGAKSGFATGLGAACADAVFSALAAFGVTAITAFIKTYNDHLQLFGGAFLLFIAWHTWHDKPRSVVDEDAPIAVRLGLGSLMRSMVSSFVITITNPATILGTMAVIATLGGIQAQGDAVFLVAGVFVGSSIWWLMLSGGTMLVRSRFTESRVMVMNRATGVILGVLAIIIMLLGATHYLGLIPEGVSVPLMS